MRYLSTPIRLICLLNVSGWVTPWYAVRKLLITVMNSVLDIHINGVICKCCFYWTTFLLLIKTQVNVLSCCQNYTAARRPSLIISSNIWLVCWSSRWSWLFSQILRFLFLFKKSNYVIYTFIFCLCVICLKEI